SPYRQGALGRCPAGEQMTDDRVKADEPSLRHSEGPFRAIVDSAADAIVSADATGRIRSWNGAAGRMFGYRADEVIGRPLTILMPEGVRQAHERGVDRFRSTGEGRITGRTVELEALRADGSTFPVELSLSTWASVDGPCFTGILRDVTERRRAQDKLSHQALHDPLTGLPNRTLVLDRIGQALARSARHDWSVGVLFFDLDRFKVVNDSLGHGAGDALLVLVVDRLRALLRPGDTLARLGGDEFLIVCEEIDGLGHARQLAERLTSALKPPFNLGDREVFATASMGIAVGRGSAATPESLLRDADAAMYKAKERGR